jgi:hypothetical protein
MMNSKGHEEELWSFSKPGQKSQWPYNKWFSAFIGKRIRYEFVRKFWDCELGKLSGVANSVQDIETITRLAILGITHLMQFLGAVTTLKKASDLSQNAHIQPGALKDLLHRIYKHLPFGAQMRQLIPDNDTPMLAHVETLKKHGLSYSLALLEAGRTREGRLEITKTTGIPEDALLDMVNRADFTRLELMSGGMVKQLVALGYGSIDSLKTADPDEYFEKAQNYYSEGKGGLPFDFTKKNVIELIAKMKQVTPIVEA